MSLNTKKFIKVRSESSLPFKTTNDLFVASDESCRFFLKQNELEHFKEIMIKKGNCSTNEAASKIAYGDVYDSHALTFYLYNYSALKCIDRFIQDKSNSVVLELGCNNGHVSRLFQRNGFKFKEYWGVDFDFSFIVDGINSFTEKDNIFKSNFCSGDFNKILNFRDEQFDLVYFQEAFDHCRDKFYYAEQCISEIKRVLKPGGILYISLVFEHEYRDLYHWDHNYVWDKFQFENMVRDYFEIVNFTPLLTFEKTLKDSNDDRVSKAYSNWPVKFSKMITAHFVNENETAVGAYILRKQ
jgi:SAM-dependent methyltransferase